MCRAFHQLILSLESVCSASLCVDRIICSEANLILFLLAIIVTSSRPSQFPLLLCIPTPSSTEIPLVVFWCTNRLSGFKIVLLHLWSLSLVFMDTQHPQLSLSLDCCDSSSEVLWPLSSTNSPRPLMQFVILYAWFCWLLVFLTIVEERLYLAFFREL
jgi:hypothetical protein